ncbi:hypothetical protein V8C34DRAFT_316635 [Trichoderma compactum]
MPSNETKNLPARDFDMLPCKRRRLRAAKSCYPCKRRKVKCNLRQPCGSCLLRGHPELCDYSVQNIPGREQLTQPGNISDGGKQLNATNERTAAINMDQGLYLDPLSHYSTRVHVGYESLPTGSEGVTLGPTTSPQTVFELLCLQDSSTLFPLTNIWAPEDGPDKESLFSILPPFINFPQSEATLSPFLYERAKSRSDVLTNPSLRSCGVQLASSDVDSEILKARVFACCAFQCLRFSNFLSFPNTEIVQTLVLLLNFLRNQADAGASCISDLTEKDEAIIHHHIWRSLIWQYTLISLCYARPLGINVLEELALTTPTGRSEARFDSFSDSSHNLFMVANKIGQALQYAKCAKEPLSLLKIRKFKDQTNQIESRSLPHIRNLFSDPVMLCLCRPAVLSGHHEYGQELGSLCMSRCRSVFNPLRRSWIFMHVTLSCALRLGVTADIGKLKSDKITICLKIPPYANALKLLGDLIGHHELDN